MPFACFSYSADVPQGSSNRTIAQSRSPARARWGWLHCFSYGADVLPGPRIGGTAQSAPSDSRRTAAGT